MGSFRAAGHGRRVTVGGVMAGVAGLALALGLARVNPGLGVLAASVGGPVWAERAGLDRGWLLAVVLAAGLATGVLAGRVRGSRGGTSCGLVPPPGGLSELLGDPAAPGAPARPPGWVTSPCPSP